MRRLLLVVALVGCHASGAPRPSADAIVEGRAPAIIPDTTDDAAVISLAQERWSIRPRISPSRDFWEDISALNVQSAERSAHTLDERTFVLALRTLMSSHTEEAAIAFAGLTANARDPEMRLRSRIGLTVALSWTSNWRALASIGEDPDAVATDSLSRLAAVERWGHALSAIAPPVIDIPAHPVTLPLYKSVFGTPIIEVRINGRPHRFWLDTGASMTMLSLTVATNDNVRLASDDSLALGVVAGHIPARAVLVDSLAIGPVVVRSLSAALINDGVLRLDKRVVDGRVETVQIDGVIGTDILRQLDLVLDPGEGTLTISRPVRGLPVARNLYWIGYPVVRLATRDGRSVLFGLDTGAEGTYVTMSLLKKLPATAVAMRRGSIGGLGSAQHRTEWVARNIALSDGEHAMSMRNIPVAPERRWTFITFDGVIGSDVALNTRLHLDFVNGIFELQHTRPGRER